MTRFSISNLLLPISFAQFCAIVHEYKQIAERAFGTPCGMEIKAMNYRKMTTSFMLDDSDMRWIDEQNRKATFFQSSELSAVSAEIFKKAVYVEVIIADRQGGCAELCLCSCGVQRLASSAGDLLHAA